jgi:hypothetical protein
MILTPCCSKTRIGKYNVVNSDSRLENFFFRFFEPLCVHYGYQKMQSSMLISNLLIKV